MSEILTHKNLQKTVKELNEKFELKLKTITTRENLITSIMDTIGNASEEQQEMLSPDAVDVYNGLLAVPPTEDEGSGETEGEDPSCSAFGVAYEPEDPECAECDMAASCQEATDAKKAEPVKAVAKSKKDKAMKTERKLSRYGQRTGTMGETIDEMLWNDGNGSLLSDIVSALMEKYGRTEAVAKAKIKSHVARLKKDGMPITTENDLYKSEVETFTK